MGAAMGKTKLDWLFRINGEACRVGCWLGGGGGESTKSKDTSSCV